MLPDFADDEVEVFPSSIRARESFRYSLLSISSKSII